MLFPLLFSSSCLFEYFLLQECPFIIVYVVYGTVHATLFSSNIHRSYPLNLLVDFVEKLSIGSMFWIQKWKWTFQKKSFLCHKLVINEKKSNGDNNKALKYVLHRLSFTPGWIKWQFIFPNSYTWICTVQIKTTLFFSYVVKFAKYHCRLIEYDKQLSESKKKYTKLEETGTSHLITILNFNRNITHKMNLILLLTETKKTQFFFCSFGKNDAKLFRKIDCDRL